jgi:hypothetical protein
LTGDAGAKDYARSLLVFALATAVRFSKANGCFGVLTHPIDDGVRGLHRGFGFEKLPFDLDRGVIAGLWIWWGMGFERGNTMNRLWKGACH